MKKNKLVALICQSFADMVAGNEDYCDYYSLHEALQVAHNYLMNEVGKEDIMHYLNPHLDMIAEKWEEFVKQ